MVFAKLVQERMCGGLGLGIIDRGSSNAYTFNYNSSLQLHVARFGFVLQVIYAGRNYFDEHTSYYIQYTPPLKTVCCIQNSS